VSEDDDRDPADDDPGLRSMRAVWLSMREEEPPSAGISALLAAAREKAEAMRPKDPWWQRALVLLRRPPVLALASVVVLLGGAIALTMRGEDMKVEGPAPALERQRAPVEAPHPQANAPSAVQPPEVAQEPDHEKPETESKGKNDVQAPRPPSAHHAAPPPPRTIAQGGHTPATGDGGRAPGRFGGEDAKPQQAAPPPERPPVKSEGGLAIATDDRGADVAPEPKAPAADESVETTGNSTRTQTSTAQLVQQCETAAARGDCAATRVTAAKIKKLDATVYKARIQSNQTIARCLK
jgi:hypothetical protein